MKKIILLIFILGFVFVSCNEDDVPTPHVDNEQSTDGGDGDDDDDPIIID